MCFCVHLAYHASMAATLSQVEDALIDNADYEEAGSVTKAKAFVTAAIRWQALASQSASNQSSSMSLDKSWVEAEKARARQFIAANETSTSGTNSRLTFLTPRYNFRG